MGINKPYELGDCEGDVCYISINGSAGSSQIAEFEWAYGDQAELGWKRLLIRSQINLLVLKE